MNIQVAVLCDAATDQNGKLNLLGKLHALMAVYRSDQPHAYAELVRRSPRTHRVQR